MRILIADDDHVCSRTMAIHLSLLGEVDSVGSGNEAVAAVQDALDQNRPYRLLFLDIIMPNGGGQETLLQIRALEAKRGIHGLHGVKVVMVSCLDDRKEVLSAFRGQAEAYLMKPVEPEKLRMILRDLGILGKDV